MTPFRFAPAFAAGGLQPSSEEMEQAIKRTSWDRLRRQEEAAGFKERPRADRMFFRRGMAHGWIDELPSELARRIEHDHGEVMQRFGYLR